MPILACVNISATVVGKIPAWDVAFAPCWTSRVHLMIGRSQSCHHALGWLEILS